MVEKLGQDLNQLLSLVNLDCIEIYCLFCSFRNTAVKIRPILLVPHYSKEIR